MLWHTKNTESPSLSRRKPKSWRKCCGTLKTQGVPPSQGESPNLGENAAAHQKHRESLPPKKKAQTLEDDAVAHQKYYQQHLTEEVKKTAAQIEC